MLKTVAKRLFKSEITFDILDQSKETMLDGNSQYHVTFRVHIIKQAVTTEAPADNSIVRPPAITVIPAPQPHSLFTEGAAFITPKLFCEIFPFHIVFDSQLVIKQYGMNIQKMRPNDYVGRKLSDLFQLTRPMIPFTFGHIEKFINASFVLEFVDDVLLTAADCDVKPRFDASALVPTTELKPCLRRKIIVIINIIFFEWVQIVL